MVAVTAGAMLAALGTTGTDEIMGEAAVAMGDTAVVDVAVEPRAGTGARTLPSSSRPSPSLTSISSLMEYGG